MQNTQLTGASQLTTKQALLPLTLITLVFCVLGFAGGLGEVLNKHFQHVLHLSKTQSTGLQASFYAAFIIGPLTYSGYIVRRYGYRISFTVGLVMFGTGALLFWPAGYKRSFGGFCGGVFVMGSGLATLETSAIPFVSSCGPPKWSALRLNMVAAVQSLCVISGLLLSSYVILDDASAAAIKKADTEKIPISLAPVQWTYLGVATFVYILAAAVFFAHNAIPEITDADMEEQVTSSSGQDDDRPLRKQYMLFWGVLAAFCFSGAQAAVGAFFINYVTEVSPRLTNRTATHRLAIAQALFTVSRFAGTLALRFVKPRNLLLVAVTAVLIILSLAIGLHGDAGVAMIILEYLAKACIGPTILALSLRGLGRHTKRGASFLVASVSSGIVFAPAMGRVADAIGTQKALVIPLTGVVVCATFPVWVSVWRAKELDADAATGAPAAAAGGDGGSVDEEKGNRKPKQRDGSVATVGSDGAETVFDCGSPTDTLVEGKTTKSDAAAVSKMPELAKVESAKKQS